MVIPIKELPTMIPTSAGVDRPLDGDPEAVAVDDVAGELEVADGAWTKTVVTLAVEPPAPLAAAPPFIFTFAKSPLTKTTSTAP